MKKLHTIQRSYLDDIISKANELLSLGCVIVSITHGLDSFGNTLWTMFYVEEK